MQDLREYEKNAKVVEKSLRTELEKLDKSKKDL